MTSQKQQKLNVNAIKVPAAKAHHPAAQSIETMQIELARYKTQQEKTPANWRVVKIEELEARLVGLAESQGWFHPELKADSGLCAPCNEDNQTDSGPVGDHETPSIRDVCKKMCGCFSCCREHKALDAAKAQLADAEQAVEAGSGSAEAVEAAKKNLEAVETAEFEESKQSASYCLNVCQTAVAMPCMVGM